MSIEILANEVKLFNINLADEQLYKTYLAVLSQDELARADRFVFPHLKKQFVVARGALRDTLAQILACTPHEINFSIATHGKPFLAGSHLQFNLSHSHEKALIAVTLNNAVGVDVEKIKVHFELGVAQKYFSAEEYAGLLAVSDKQDQVNMFYQIWSRKEALIKCSGLGVHHKLAGFSVPTASEISQASIKLDNEEYFLSSVQVTDGYAAAVVTRYAADIHYVF